MNQCAGITGAIRAVAASGVIVAAAGFGPSCGENFEPAVGGAGTAADASAGAAADASATGGTAGTSGNAGSGGVTTCTGTADCDDGDPCNGSETCDGGTCQPGEPFVCDNPDPAHCAMSCVSSSGSASCKLIGKDADTDQHLDAACTQSAETADDCDDTVKAVHPGATEICNGIDDDCNGKDELDEGSQIYGGAADFITGVNAQFPSIAWSDAKQYGVAWVREFGQIYFSRMSPVGAKLTPNDDVAVGTGSAPRIAWGHDAYAIAWAEPAKVSFRMLSTAGTTLSTVIQVNAGTAKPETVDVAATPAGWVVVWSDGAVNVNGKIYARLLGADGTPGPTEQPFGPVLGTNQAPHVAASATQILITWSYRDYGGSNPSPNVIKVLRTGLDLTTKGEQIVSTNPPPTGTGADLSFVTPTSLGWAFAWREYGSATEKLGLYELKSDGSSGCTPTVTSTGGSPGGVAARAGSRVVAYLSSTATFPHLKLVRFKTACASPIEFDLTSTDYPSVSDSGASIAWGDSGAAVVWTDQTTGLYNLRRWVMGPNLCDPPLP